MNSAADAIKVEIIWWMEMLICTFTHFELSQSKHTEPRDSKTAILCMTFILNKFIYRHKYKINYIYVEALGI